MTSTFGWASDTPGLFCASAGTIGRGAKRYMVVEALPEGGWEWLAWANDGSHECMHGTALDRIDAMEAAEDAALLLLLASSSPPRRALKLILN